MTTQEKYGHSTQLEARLYKNKLILSGVKSIIAMCGFALLVLGMLIVLGGCTINLNIAADGQPVNITYQNDGKME